MRGRLLCLTSVCLLSPWLSCLFTWWAVLWKMRNVAKTTEWSAWLTWAKHFVFTWVTLENCSCIWIIPARCFWSSCQKSVREIFLQPDFIITQIIEGYCHQLLPNTQKWLHIKITQLNPLITWTSVVWLQVLFHGFCCQ